MLVVIGGGGSSLGLFLEQDDGHLLVIQIHHMQSDEHLAGRTAASPPGIVGGCLWAVDLWPAGVEMGGPRFG